MDTRQNKTPGEVPMKRWYVLIVIISVLTGTQARAKSSHYVFTGKDIYESCRHAVAGLDKAGEYDDHRFGVCAGYIAGIVDFHTVVTTVESLPGDMFCLPEDISTAEVMRSVTQYLADNTRKHHDLAAYLVILALQNAYPCQEDISGK